MEREVLIYQSAKTGAERWWLPRPWNYSGQVGHGSEQPLSLENVPCRGVGPDGFQRLLLTQTTQVL